MIQKTYKQTEHMVEYTEEAVTMVKVKWLS